MRTDADREITFIWSKFCTYSLVSIVLKQFSRAQFISLKLKLTSLISNLGQATGPADKPIEVAYSNSVQ
ncbi:hypothetical protein CREGCYN_05250 [Synechococcus sp. M16CYN]